ncbi:MAG: redoxin domain-containing protein [Planctomycetaceae bacterium]|nr:redoxin domain-containing protein [Planctomycetaceae bacterium]
MILLLAATITACITPRLNAQDNAAETKKADVETKSEDLFTIPDGTAEELFQFINTVKQTPLPGTDRSREKTIAHLKAQVAAVLATLDKIDAAKPDEAAQVKVIQERMSAYQALAQIDDAAAAKLKELIASLEKDERPAVTRLVSSFQLRSQIQNWFQLTNEQQTVALQKLFDYMDRFGLDSTSYGLSTALGEALEDGDMMSTSAKIYTRLATELRKANNPEYGPDIASLEGKARRLNLPGNFMDVMGTTAEGEKFDWAAYRGKVVLVDFWASWCGPCRGEIPNMKAQLEKYGDKGFAIVGINLDNTKEEYQRYVDREKLAWVNLMSPNENERGWDNPMAVHYGISGIPTAILVDREGKVVEMEARGEQLNMMLEKLLGPPSEEAK